MDARDAALQVIPTPRKRGRPPRDGVAAQRTDRRLKFGDDEWRKLDLMAAASGQKWHDFVRGALFYSASAPVPAAVLPEARLMPVPTEGPYQDRDALFHALGQLNRVGALLKHLHTQDFPPDPEESLKAVREIRAVTAEIHRQFIDPEPPADRSDGLCS